MLMRVLINLFFFLFMSAEKVGLPSSPPYLAVKSNKNKASFLTGVSFASGGAGIFNSSDQALVSQTINNNDNNPLNHFIMFQN